MNEQKLISALEAYGADLRAIRDRFLNNFELYYDCLSRLPDDASFDELGSALDRDDLDAAFSAAHALKGVVANMGLTPLFNILVEIVETLRAGSAENLSEPYKNVLVHRERLREMYSIGAR